MFGYAILINQNNWKNCSFFFNIKYDFVCTLVVISCDRVIYIEKQKPRQFIKFTTLQVTTFMWFLVCYLAVFVLLINNFLLLWYFCSVLMSAGLRLGSDSLIGNFFKYFKSELPMHLRCTAMSKRVERMERSYNKYLKITVLPKLSIIY